MTYKAYFLLGSNMPLQKENQAYSKREIIQASANELIKALMPQNASKECVTKMSDIEETEPWGEFDTKPETFVNQAVMCTTDKTPADVLKICQEIENCFGRQRKNALQHPSYGERVYENRTLDIDILKMFDNAHEITLNTVNLQLPHPRLKEREFAQKLLNQIL